MKSSFQFVTGWLSASGNNCFGHVPSGTLLYRIATVAPTSYSTGFVSTAGGTCKPFGESGNWYASDLPTALAEAKPTGQCVYEVWLTTADVLVFDARSLPPTLWQQIHNDRELSAPMKFQKSLLLWSGVAELQQTTRFTFQSRQWTGTVITLNPHATPMRLSYTGTLPPTG